MEKRRQNCGSRMFAMVVGALDENTRFAVLGLSCSYSRYFIGLDLELSKGRLVGENLYGKDWL
jgi:hypothetical protein